jgi:hypothetical protein
MTYLEKSEEIVDALRNEPYNFLRNDHIINSLGFKKICKSNGISTRMVVCIRLAQASWFGLLLVHQDNIEKDHQAVVVIDWKNLDKKVKERPEDCIFILSPVVRPCILALFSGCLCTLTEPFICAGFSYKYYT